VVPAVASLADVLRPKSFAGLVQLHRGAGDTHSRFGEHGGDYVAIEARSMAVGALAFEFFSVFVCQLIHAPEFECIRGFDRGTVGFEGVEFDTR
jgi:hypothetical protein